MLLHKIRVSSKEDFWLIFFIMKLTVGVDSAIQSRRLLTTSSQGALFLPKMSIQTDTTVLDNIYTEKSVAIIILKHPTNGISIYRYLLWIYRYLKGNILWDFSSRTDSTIQANRPDTVIKHKQNKMCQFR